VYDSEIYLFKYHKFMLYLKYLLQAQMKHKKYKLKLNNKFYEK